MFATIRYEVEGPVATVTLHRPDKLNAFTGRMADELIAAFDRADGDDAVRAVVVTGAGRAFCAGADLSAGAATFDYAKLGGALGEPGGADAGSSPVRDDGSVDWSYPLVRDTGGRVSLRIYASLKPVIGAINGAAVGIGATMTLPMDVRLASEEARFGFVFARRGIVPEAASSWFLPRVVGVGRALEWCLTGRVFPASEALAGGLVRSVHPAGELLPAARALALEMAEAAPVSAALARRMIWGGLTQAHPMEAHRLDSRLVFQRGRGADAAEGVASFLEKRPASYPDRVSDRAADIREWWEEPPYR